MRIYELDDQSGKFGCRTTKFNFQTELFKQMSDNGNPFKIYYDRLQLRETRFIVPHADVQGTDAKKSLIMGKKKMWNMSFIGMMIQPIYIIIA